MTQSGKRRWFFCFMLLLLLATNGARASTTPEVDKVLRHGFPERPEVLAKTTSALFSEYTDKKNVASLIFYSYGLLRQAKYFAAVNDFIHAAEYAKAGFFCLDEAVDANEQNLRIRYLRARIDAYLPADIGRCVVTLHDTQLLLKTSTEFASDTLEHIDYMRYRALLSCNQQSQAKALLEKLKTSGTAKKYLELDSVDAPEWDIREVTQIVMPLLKGE